MNAASVANPYVGPRTFTTEEGDLFFGREREARDLLSVVITERLVLFYAQSGAGKSSLINTRLIPGLEAEGEYRILPVGRLLGEARKPEEGENIYVLNLITSLIRKKIDRSQLAGLTLSGFLAGLDYEEQDGYFYNEHPSVEPAAVGERPSKFVLIVDQFEELFTTYPEEWHKREDFLRQLAQAMDDFPNLQFVLTLREDYIALLEPYAHLVPNSFRCRYYMERLNQRGALEAIQGPARRLGRPFVPEVAQKLVNDLSTVQVRQPDETLELQPGQYVEPVQLQVVCYSLWDQLPDDCTQITQKHLDDYVGDVDKALGNYFAARMETVTREMKALGRDVSEHEVRNWFGTRLITSDGIRNMVAQEKGGRSGGLDDFVVQEFVRKGDLVRAEKRGGATFYELTHDRLVEPILQNNREWFKTKADLLQTRTSVWLGQGRNASFLLRGQDLRTARKLVRSRPSSTDERAFLETSSRSERTRLTVAVITGLVLLMLILLTLFAVNQTNQAQVQKNRALVAVTSAEQNRILAQSNAETAQASAKIASTQQAIASQNEEAARNLSEVANAQRSIANAQIYQNAPGGLFKSSLLAMSAMIRSPSAQAEEILRENLTFLPRRVQAEQIQQEGLIEHMIFGNDGSTLYAASWDNQKKRGQLCGWSLKDSSKIFCRNLSLPVDKMALVNNQLMASNTQGQVTIVGWTVTSTPAINISTVNFPDQDIESLEVGPDGLKVLIIGTDRTMTVKYIYKPELENFYMTKTTIPHSVTEFSPKAQYLAAGTKNGTVAFWGLKSGSYEARTDHRGQVNVLRFTPDEHYLLSGAKDHYVMVTNLLSRELLYRLPHSGSVELLEVSPDGTWFASASDDRQIRVWDLQTGKEKVRFLQDSPITDLKISPQGQLILTMGADKNLRAWNAETGREVLQIPLTTSHPVLSFNSQNGNLYTGDQQGRVSVWDISTLATPARSLELNGMAENIQYLPSGQVAFTDQNRVWILPLDTFQHRAIPPRDSEIAPATKTNSPISRLAISPDASYIAVTTEENELIVMSPANKIYLSFKPQGTVKDLTFSSDGQRVITLDTEGTVQAWEIIPKAVPTDLTSPGQAASAISAGSGFIAVGTPGTIWLLDRFNSKTPVANSASGDHILLAVSPDGSLLADALADGTVNLWKQSEGKLSQEKDQKKLQVPQVLSLAFNPDGTRLAVGTAKNVFLIDTANGQEVARIPNPDLVNDISFSADGNVLSVASSNLIQTWELGSMQPTSNLVQAACDRIGGNLDESQWKDVLPQEDYDMIMSACDK